MAMLPESFQNRDGWAARRYDTVVLTVEGVLSRLLGAMEAHTVHGGYTHLRSVREKESGSMVEQLRSDKNGMHGAGHPALLRAMLSSPHLMIRPSGYPQAYGACH